MQRRAKNETIEPFRRRKHGPEGLALNEALANILKQNAEALSIAEPKMPEGVEDRSADVWEPLVAIADLAGGDWPIRARVAAVAHVAASQDDTPNQGIQLLSDIQAEFGNEIQLPTALILERLRALPETQWSEAGGNPLNDRGLANQLKAVWRQTERNPTWKGYSARLRTSRIGRRLGAQSFSCSQQRRNNRNTHGENPWWPIAVEAISVFYDWRPRITGVALSPSLAVSWNCTLSSIEALGALASVGQTVIS